MEIGTANVDAVGDINLLSGDVLQVRVTLSSPEKGNYAFEKSEKKNQNEER